MQARIKQVIAQIGREKRKKGEKYSSTKHLERLIQRYQILENELYNQWREDKHRIWAQWIKKVNALDHKKATRKFYSEIR